MSNSGANNLCVASMGVGTKRALEKGLHALFLRLSVCLFSFQPEGLLEVCLSVFEFLGVFFFFFVLSPTLQRLPLVTAELTKQCEY